MSDFPDMGDAFSIEAPAKTNLWLRILGKRKDGFHEIETRMVKLSLADQLRLKWREDDSVVLQCSDSELPSGEENLVVKAVRALEKYCGKSFAISIELDKRIPVGAGLGGGSSDAAAVLKSINKMAGLGLSEGELAKIGATIGSDIPFFFFDGPCDCRGRGELVEPVDEILLAGEIVLIKPAFAISAGWAYKQFAESCTYEDFSYEPQESAWGALVNDLERPVFDKYPVLGAMKNWLKEQPGVQAALMSGSGSTMLAIVESEAIGIELAGAVTDRYGENCWTWCGRTLEA
ncbi:MAG: 4-(cytidine 5'-diphospho)-2-C-methyl-D-erythritol kinase [Verrucomicrobiales bacterium]|nr:4-(cytidine 5'-diphospho)-2-C-methyl-D-erythritol kinase [Verrucomicrobiales bacterium]